MVWSSRGDGRFGSQLAGLVAAAIVVLLTQCSPASDPTLVEAVQSTDAEPPPAAPESGLRPDEDALIVESAATDGSASDATDGSASGATDGAASGATDGTAPGATDGAASDATDGSASGATDGSASDATDGSASGATDGTTSGGVAGGKRMSTATTERSNGSAGASSRPGTVSGTRNLLRERQGTFTFDPDGVGPDRGPIDVLYQQPQAGELSTAPILIVMPGNSRTAANYLDSWSEHADEYGAVLLVPLFPRDSYDTRDYNRGNLLDADNRPNPSDRWTFTVIEALHASVAESIGSSTGGYYLYGHSAGAQFVHRFMLYMADNHVIRAVSANAGWYTVPDPGIAFPYGTEGGPSISMSRALRTPLVIMAGIDDDDPEAANLRTTDEADQQGRSRYERAIHFYDQGQAAADAAGVELRWTLHIVPGVAHSNHDMAPFAAKVLFNP